MTHLIIVSHSQTNDSGRANPSQTSTLCNNHNQRIRGHGIQGDIGRYKGVGWKRTWVTDDVCIYSLVQDILKPIR